MAPAPDLSSPGSDLGDLGQLAQRLDLQEAAPWLLPLPTSGSPSSSCKVARFTNSDRAPDEALVAKNSTRFV